MERATNLGDRYMTEPGWRLVPFVFEGSSIAPGSEAWTVPKALSRAWRIWRRAGAKCLCLKVLGETVYRRLWLLALDLEQPPVPTSSGTEATVRALEGTQRDASLYAAFRINTSPQEFFRRTSDGGKCFAAIHEGRVISATWTYVGEGPFPYLGAYLEAGPSEIVLDDSYTLPAFRGRGFSPAITRAIARYYRARGFRLILTSVLPENTVSLRVREKTQFRICGMVGYLGPGFWRRHFCKIYPGFLPWSDA